MVQGDAAFTSNSFSVSSRTQEARKAGFEALKKFEVKQDYKQSNKDDKHGAWGPVFKNKEHFTNLHIC